MKIGQVNMSIHSADILQAKATYPEADSNLILLMLVLMGLLV